MVMGSITIQDLEAKMSLLGVTGIHISMEKGRWIVKINIKTMPDSSVSIGRTFEEAILRAVDSVERMAAWEMTMREKLRELPKTSDRLQRKAEAEAAIMDNAERGLLEAIDEHDKG